MAYWPSYGLRLVFFFVIKLFILLHSLCLETILPSQKLSFYLAYSMSNIHLNFNALAAIFLFLISNCILFCSLCVKPSNRNKNRVCDLLSRELYRLSYTGFCDIFMWLLNGQHRFVLYIKHRNYEEKNSRLQKFKIDAISNSDGHIGCQSKEGLYTLLRNDCHRFAYSLSKWHF